MLVDSGRMLPANAGVRERLVAMRGQFVWLYATVIALAAFSSARFYMVTWIGERVTADLRQAVYSHVLRQSPQFFETLKTGEVLSRLTNDITVIQNAVGSSISLGLRNSVLLVGALALLIATSPRLMLIVAGVIALVVAPALIIGRRVRRLSRASQDRIADTSGIAGDLLRAAAATERLSELLATRPQMADPPAPRELPSGVHAGLRVDLQEVTFAYPSRPGRPVIDDLSLIIEAGQTVALVGPSGAGKSTIFQLLQRFYDVSDGSVLVGGVDVRQLRLADLRGRMAVVPQEPVIFSGTVLDNIRYGRPGATVEEALAAGRAAHVEEFVGQLPQRYDTYVGERGLRLSGGQRQRVAIARAILKNAPLLLLDEATSSLDAESERAVQLALETAMRGRTTIVIAHRLATVQRAERIFVLDHGAIVDSGTHAELVARAGLYRRLAAVEFSL